MRYQPVIHRDAAGLADGWSIWDVVLSPQLQEAGESTVHCSLDGQSELVFRRLAQAMGWLGACERSGLDLEVRNSQVTHGDNGVWIKHSRPEDYVITEASRPISGEG